MESRTTFRFAASGVSFEIGGSDAFVRQHLPTFLPFVDRVAGATSESQASRTDPPKLAEWYARHLPPGTHLTRQDSILVFALWMRSFKKYIFTSEDIRRAFDEIGETTPKSLLQILGTLKRTHNLILGTDRRGEYMLNTTGIARARALLGITRRPLRPAPPRSGGKR